MSPKRVYTAREAFDDCISYFEEQIKPTLNKEQLLVASDEFNPELLPDNEDAFKVQVKITHALLPCFLNRYPHAKFEFLNQRERIGSLREAFYKRNPLQTHAVTFTINFEPYGKVGGFNSDDGGNPTNGSDISVNGPAPDPKTSTNPKSHAKSPPKVNSHS